MIKMLNEKDDNFILVAFFADWKFLLAFYEFIR